jgi:hypothetical protein
MSRINWNKIGFRLASGSLPKPISSVLSAKLGDHHDRFYTVRKKYTLKVKLFICHYILCHWRLLFHGTGNDDAKVSNTIARKKSK